MFYKILITIVMAAMLVTSANAQTITPTGLSQGDLVALLQRIVNMLGSGVGSTYITADSASGYTQQLLRRDAVGAGISAPSFGFQRSKDSVTDSSPTIVASGDPLGTFAWLGANGTTFDPAAYISAEVDGTPGASADMPGRLLFWTSPDASATPAIRMRINNAGNVSIASTDIATTVAKAAVGGRVRLDGTVTGTNTAASPVLDLEFFDQSDSSTKTAQSAGAGYVSLLAVKTSAGKHALWMVGPTGTTVEVAIEP